MTKWLDRARREISEIPGQGAAKRDVRVSEFSEIPGGPTAKRDVRVLTAATAAPSLHFFKKKQSTPEVLPKATEPSDSKVIQFAQRCEHCSRSKELEGAPAWRRDGRIVQIIEPDGRRTWGCQFCGRRVK